MACSYGIPLRWRYRIAGRRQGMDGRGDSSAGCAPYQQAGRQLQSCKGQERPVRHAVDQQGRESRDDTGKYTAKKQAKTQTAFEDRSAMCDAEYAEGKFHALQKTILIQYRSMLLDAQHVDGHVEDV